jgi:hypothetical protein
MFMGEVAEMARRIPLLLKEAQERDDRYAITNLTLVLGTFVRLAADEPEQARCQIEQVMTQWSQQGFHVQHMEALYDEAQIALYQQPQGRAAQDRLEARWTTLTWSHFYRVQQVRIYMRDLHGRCALAAGGLRSAERDARLLQREQAPWAEELARLIQAQAALARGATARAVTLLREAIAGFERVAMALHAAAARRLLGRVVGGEEGQTLIAQADEWMKGQRIENPGRLACLLAPGCPEEEAARK